MEKCLVCLLADDLYQCNDCGKNLCDQCIVWKHWEDNDYSTEGGVLYFDIEYCEECSKKY